jgi:hypothetical protein
MDPEMKIIALMPVRNEAWVLPHSLACLSAFCDVILVNDQSSEDESREICRRFPKVGSCSMRRAATTAATCCGAPTRTS